MTLAWASLATCLHVLPGCQADQSTNAPSTFERTPLVIDHEAWQSHGLRGRRIRTRHFTIYSTVRDAMAEELLPGFLENLYDRFEQLLPPRNSTEGRIELYALGDRGEWDRFVHREFRQAVGDLDMGVLVAHGGLTIGERATCFYSTRADLFSCAAHEAFHAYHNIAVDDSLPSWLAEGMATYYESALPHNERLQHNKRHNSIRRNGLCRSIQIGRTLTVEQLATTTSREILNERDRYLVAAYYGQMWALVSFLKDAGPQNLRDSFKQLTTDLRDGRFKARVSAAAVTTPESADLPYGLQVFHAYFGPCTADLESAYADYLLEVCGF